MTDRLRRVKHPDQVIVMDCSTKGFVVVVRGRCLEHTANLAIEVSKCDFGRNGQCDGLAPVQTERQD